MSRMPQIGAEVAGFLLAVIAGGVARLLYQSLVCFREMARHSYLAMGIEDILYWMGTAVYFFVQIYHTSSGGIRWSFLLGCVGGAVFASFLIKKIEKIEKKSTCENRINFLKILREKRKEAKISLLGVSITSEYFRRG